MLDLVKWSIFILFSIANIVFSWEALHQVKSHGFFRFFVFEALLGIILVNLDYWFDDPFSPVQVISWILLFGSFALAVHGFCLLNQVGKPNHGIENTSRLVKVGAYKLIRHPLYSSLLMFAVGAFLKQISVFSIVMLLAVIVLTIITARIEEDENLERFGNEYSHYIKTTKMFIPILF